MLAARERMLRCAGRRLTPAPEIGPRLNIALDPLHQMIDPVSVPRNRAEANEDLIG